MMFLFSIKPQTWLTHFDVNHVPETSQLNSFACQEKSKPFPILIHMFSFWYLFVFSFNSVLVSCQQ